MYRPLSDTWPDYQLVEDRLNDVGALAVGVPGTLRGWCEALQRYGTFSLNDALQPAIRHAENGFRATTYLHEIIHKVAVDIARCPETANTYLPGGTPLAPGDLVRQRDYAQTLTTIGQDGPDVLYRGELGARAVEHIQREGGLITADDLKNYHTAHTNVVHGQYRGYDIYGPAPPSAGGVHIVEMLNILAPFDIAAMGFGSADATHLLAEILKLGFDDRRRHTGDPAFVDVPVEMLVSPQYADERRRLIDFDHALSLETGFHTESDHTTHVTTADADGNVVAATHTIHAAFGAKVTVPGTGMLLNNTMNIFDPHPGLANSIQPGKRMTSSMSPIIVEKDGKPAFALGSVGGTRIFPSVFQAIVNMIDHGMSPTEALEAPRIWTLGDIVEVEKGLADDVKNELVKRGHHIDELKIIGAGMGLIQFDGHELVGASCWRADGTPIGLAGGMARGGIRFEL
jgi:gamma-glutamyltranspeptidase/glutathione hydrolase